MPDTDGFAALYRPITPLAPGSKFVAGLRRRLAEELGMTVADTPITTDGQLALVHLRVADADRAMRFFGELCGWQGERVLFGDHVSHYTLNTDITVRILDDPGVPPVVPNYAVTDVAGAADAVRDAGGTVTDSEVAADGGGWARGFDDQGVPWLVFRPGRRHEHGAVTRQASAGVGLIFIRANAPRAARFYGQALGWHLERVHPDSNYFDVVPRIGIFDEAAAFNTDVEPSATLYLMVGAMAPMLARVEELGGQAGVAAQDFGPYFSAVCHDDQGTMFGLMAERME